MPRQFASAAQDRAGGTPSGYKRSWLGARIRSRLTVGQVFQWNPGGGETQRSRSCTAPCGVGPPASPGRERARPSLSGVAHGLCPQHPEVWGQHANIRSEQKRPRMKTDMRHAASRFGPSRTFCLPSRSKGEQVPTFAPAGVSAAIESLLMASQQQTQKRCCISDSSLKRPVSRPRQSPQVELSFSAN